MRKILAVLLALMLMLSLVACVDNEKPNEDYSSAISESEEMSEPDEEEESSEDGEDSSEEDEDTTTTEDEDDETTTEDEDETTTEDEDETTTSKSKRTTTKRSSRTTKKSTTKKTTTTEDEDDTTTEEETTVTTASTTMSREEYLNQEKITLVGSPSDEKGWVYRLGSGGIAVRETTIDSGRGGDPVEIVQISDIHFNKLNEKDYEENNPVIMHMKDYRTLNKNGSSQRQAENCLKYASYFDQTVVTGDTIDYLTWGAIEMVQEVIWKNYPDTLVTLGNHDSVRTWTHKGMVADKTTRESRYEILEQEWKHDIYYTSKVVGNKAMVIQMDNGSTYFHDSQVDKLEADIKTAKEKGYVILLFVHIPLSTGNKEDSQVSVIRGSDGAETVNLYQTACNVYSKPSSTIYKLITNNADVIKGVFCGHEHVDAYAEIQAKTSDGQAAVIPEYVLTGAFYQQGTVMKIKVK